jgi:hypothetical protein
MELHCQFSPLPSWAALAPGRGGVGALAVGVVEETSTLVIPPNYRQVVSFGAIALAAAAAAGCRARSGSRNDGFRDDRYAVTILTLVGIVAILALASICRALRHGEFRHGSSRSAPILPPWWRLPAGNLVATLAAALVRCGVRTVALISLRL